MVASGAVTDRERNKLLLSKASNQLATVLHEAPKLDEDGAGGKLSNSAIRRAPQVSHMAGLCHVHHNF